MNVAGNYLQSAFGRYAILFFGCVVFHVIGTWNLPLIDRDEPRFAEASREMLQRGNYVVPFFNNDYRFDKPPLTYWAQTASYRVFGENDFAARLPSVIAAALVAVALLAWGTRISSEEVGWWAAIIFTLSLQTFIHAKAAVADMWLVLFMTLAFWAGYEMISNSKRSTSNAQRPTPNWFWWTVFYVSLAFAFLAKGPIGFLPLLTIALAKWQDRQLQVWKRFAFGRGLALAFAIIALWAVPAYLQTNGEFWRVGLGRHVVGRSLGAMEGHGASSFGMYLLLLPFYFVTVFVSFFPWSIKLPGLIRKLWRKKDTGVSDPGYSGRDNIDSFLLGGIAIVFIIFSIVGTKLPHYTLPAFPLLALMMACALVPQGIRFLRNCAVVAAVLWLAIAAIVPPLVARSFPAFSLAQEARDLLRPEMEFGAVKFTEPSVVWYFRSRINGFMTLVNKREAPGFMSKDGSRCLILPSSSMETLFPNRPDNWKTFSTRGFNIAGGKWVELTLLIKPE